MNLYGIEHIISLFAESVSIHTHALMFLNVNFFGLPRKGVLRSALDDESYSDVDYTHAVNAHIYVFSL